MTRRVLILGMGAEGPSSLPRGSREAIAAATFLAGGRRHLELAGPSEAETFTITNNLGELVERLRGRGGDERCVVLASGDPLFFGIAHVLGRSLGNDQIEVVPAVSSMQLAFARAGIAWHDAAIASIHGRPLAETLLPLLNRPKIGLFTQDGASPSAVAEFFLARGLADSLAVVGEDLGTADERVLTAPLGDLVGRRFSDLNVLILLRSEDEAQRRGAAEGGVACPTPAIACPPDSCFAQPESGPVLLSHADIRAVALARFWGLPDGPIWDIGAGLGGVSVALARTFPGREVLAVERSPIQASYLRENRRRFEAYNLRVLVEEAPGCLEGEAPPAGVFLGGSGGKLDATLELLDRRLPPGGRFVADFVTLENLARCLERLKVGGWPVEVTQVQVSHGRDLAGLTALAPLRPVWVVGAVHP